MSSRGIARRLMNTSYFVQLERVYCERHPLCMKCLEAGLITPSRFVIHRRPLMEHSRPEDQRRAIYDPANFIAVCRDHWAAHTAEPPRYEQPDHTDEPPSYQQPDHDDDVINFL